MSDVRHDTVERVRQLMAKAMREMERRAEADIEAFNRLSPQEQAERQLRQWEIVLGATHE